MVTAPPIGPPGAAAPATAPPAHPATPPIPAPAAAPPAVSAATPFGAPAAGATAGAPAAPAPILLDQAPPPVDLDDAPVVPRTRGLFDDLPGASASGGPAAVSVTTPVSATPSAHPTAVTAPAAAARPMLLGQIDAAGQAVFQAEAQNRPPGERRRRAMGFAVPTIYLIVYMVYMFSFGGAQFGDTAGDHDDYVNGWELDQNWTTELRGDQIEVGSVYIQVRDPRIGQTPGNEWWDSWYSLQDDTEGEFWSDGPANATLDYDSGELTIMFDDPPTSEMSVELYWREVVEDRAGSEADQVFGILFSICCSAWLGLPILVVALRALVARPVWNRMAIALIWCMPIGLVSFIIAVN